MRKELLRPSFSRSDVGKANDGKPSGVRNTISVPSTRAIDQRFGLAGRHDEPKDHRVIGRAGRLLVVDAPGRESDADIAAEQINPGRLVGDDIGCEWLA